MTSSPPLSQIEDIALADVRGGLDWVDIGAGFGAGYCAFGPIGRSALKFARAWLAKPKVL